MSRRSACLLTIAAPWTFICRNEHFVQQRACLLRQLEYSLTHSQPCRLSPHSIFHRSGRKSDRRIGAQELSGASGMYGAHISHSGAQPVSASAWNGYPFHLMDQQLLTRFNS